jgi:hypothetical protein
MMAKAKVVVVIDAFPKALELVIGSIQEAINRGVKIYIQAYEPIEILGADIATSTIAKKSLEHWKSEQLNVIVDGEEYLVALLNKSLTEVIQASWSTNYFMACMLHAGRMHEQTIIKINDKIGSKDFEKKVIDLLEKQKYFYNSNIPGFNKLFNTK